MGCEGYYYTNARVLPVLDVIAVIVKSVHQLHCIIELYVPICIIVIVNLTGSTQTACCYNMETQSEELHVLQNR